MPTPPTPNALDLLLPEVATGSVREVGKNEKIGFNDKMKMNRNADKATLCTMWYRNGTMRTFVITTSEPLFKYRGGLYHLQHEKSWFDLNYNYYRLNYDEGFPEPLDKEIIRKGDIGWWTVNPENLKPIVKAEVFTGLLESAEIHKWLKTCLILIVVNTFIVGGVLVYLLLKGGVKFG
jgi:hypothetical protein